MYFDITTPKKPGEVRMNPGQAIGQLARPFPHGKMGTGHPSESSWCFGHGIFMEKWANQLETSGLIPRLSTGTRRTQYTFHNSGNPQNIA
jgi:hypothetical protein